MANSVDLTRRNRLPLWKKLVYGFGSSPSPISSTCVALFHMTFLLETCGLTPAQFAAVQFTGRFWDAVTDPVVGFLVSKTRTRWGEMRPWMFFSTPLGALAFLGLFRYIEWNPKSKFAYYFVMYLLFQLFLTMYYVPYTSLVMKIVKNRRERDSLSVFRIANEVISLLTSVGLFGYWTSTKRVINACSSSVSVAHSGNMSTPTTSMQPTLQQFQDERDVYFWSAVIITGWYFLSGWLCSIMLKELPSTEDFFDSRTSSSGKSSSSEEPHNLEEFHGDHMQIVVSSNQLTTTKKPLSAKKTRYWHKIKSILKFKPYTILMMAFLFSSLGIQFVQSNIVFYVSYSLDMPGEVQQALIMVMSMSCLAIPVTHKLSCMFGKSRIYSIACLLFLPVLLSAMFIPKRLNKVLFYAIWSYSGLCLGAVYLLPWSMLPDVIQCYNETKTNKIRVDEATFYAFYVFFNKFAVSLASIYSSLMLDFAQYKRENYCSQPPMVGLVLRYAIFPCAMIFLILAAVIVHFYPIDERLNRKNTLDTSDSEASEEETRKNSIDPTDAAFGGPWHLDTPAGLESPIIVRPHSHANQEIVPPPASPAYNRISSIAESMDLSWRDLPAWDASIVTRSGVAPPEWEKAIVTGGRYGNKSHHHQGSIRKRAISETRMRNSNLLQESAIPHEQTHARPEFGTFVNSAPANKPVLRKFSRPEPPSSHLKHTVLD